MAHTFIVSDESVNSYGYIVLTQGINTEAFERNPIMFYMHNRANGIVGRWENIRKEGAKLLADAVFDDTTELGRQVKRQVENGFLRCASVGIENVVKERSNGVETIVECDLKEISIVDIPANGNAVKLYRKNGQCVYKLSDLDDTEPQDLRTQILALLELENDASDAQVLDALKSLLKSPENIDKEIERAVLCGYIDESQRDNFRSMALANRKAFMSFVDTKRMEQEPIIARMVAEAAGKGKLLFNEREIYENIGRRLGLTVLNELLSTLKGAIKPNELINKGANRSEWTLSDYRKFAPEELRDNPELYSRLVAKEGREPLAEPRTLDYYRRHNPEYLKTHPEEYKRLLEKENAND